MAKKYSYYHYFVEGENEKNLLKEIKGTLLQNGMISVFNVLEKNSLAIQLKKIREGTCVVFVFDTDILDEKKVKNLVENLKACHVSKNVMAVSMVPQILNFQDELVYATTIKSAKEFTQSSSEKDFKRDFNNLKNIKVKLEKVNFDITKFWSRESKVLEELLEKEKFSSKKLQKIRDNGTILRVGNKR